MSHEPLRHGCEILCLRGLLEHTAVHLVTSRPPPDRGQMVLKIPTSQPGGPPPLFTSTGPTLCAGRPPEQPSSLSLPLLFGEFNIHRPVFSPINEEMLNCLLCFSF